MSLDMADNSMLPRKKMTLDYHFMPRELSSIARLLRKMATDIPDELADFYSAVERAVYDSLSIDEAEQFYS